MRPSGAPTPTGQGARKAFAGLPSLAGLLLPLAMAAVLWHIGADSAWQRALALPPGTWLLALAGLLCSYLMRAARLSAEWRGHTALGPGLALRITLQHLAALSVLPLRSGELGYPLLLHRRSGIPLSDAMVSLLWMRLQDAIVLATLGGLLAMAVLQDQERLPWALALALMLAWAAALLMGTWLLRRWLVTSPSGAGTSGRTPGRWARLRSRIAQALQRARRLTWWWCAGNWLVKLGTVAMLMRELAGLTPQQAWSGALGGELGAALPVQAPAGFGTYEAGSALAATLAGSGAWAELLASALVVHLFTACTAVLAGSLAMLLPSPPTPTTEIHP